MRLYLREERTDVAYKALGIHIFVADIRPFVSTVHSHMNRGMQRLILRKSTLSYRHIHLQ